MGKKGLNPKDSQVLPGKPTMSDVSPIENGNFPQCHVSFQGFFSVHPGSSC